MKMDYHCDLHGVWDANRASGCPECMREARQIISRYREAARVAIKDWEMGTFDQSSIEHLKSIAA